MSKNKVFQWILYFPSQNIVLNKKWYVFFLENFKISTNNLCSVEAALVCIMVLFWCLMQCWIRWIDFIIGEGKKGILETGISWTRVYTQALKNFLQSGYVQRVYMSCKIINPGNGYIWFAKLSFRATGIYDLQKIINLGNGYIWFAKLSIQATRMYDLQNYQSGQRSWM